MSLTKLSLGGNNLYMISLFPPRESLVSDILAGDRNIENLFYGVEIVGGGGGAQLAVLRINKPKKTARTHYLL